MDARGIRTGDVLWSGVEATAGALLSLASGLIVARIVGPAEFGIGAALVAVHVLLSVPVTALFADALAQRTLLTRSDAGAAVAASVAVGAAGALVQASAGLLLRAPLADARLPAMGALLALALPLAGAAGPSLGLLMRARAYRSIAARTLIGQGIGTATGIAAAWMGAGAWAVVLQQAVTGIAGAVVLLAAAPPCRVRLSVPHVARLLRFGLPLALSTLVQHGRYRVFAVLIGVAAGPRILGQVHMAFRLVDAGRDLANTALWRLLLPRFAACQHDAAALQAAVDRASRAIALVLLPLFGALLVAIAPLVALALGPAWMPAAQAALPLILLAWQNLLLFAPGAATIARGRPAVFLAGNAASLVLTALFCAAMPPRTPLAAAAIWCAAQMLPLPFVLRAMAATLATTQARQLRPGVPGLLLAAAATASGFAIPALADPGASAAPLLAERLAVFAAVAAAAAARLAAPRLRRVQPA
jgi:PST family polysaccharide transporter